MCFADVRFVDLWQINMQLFVRGQQTYVFDVAAETVGEN